MTVPDSTPKPALKPNPIARGARVSPKKAFDHFGLLEHSLGNVDPGFWTAAGAKSDAALQKRLDDALAKHPAWANLRIAIADLSGGAPKFAGNLAAGTKGLPGETISALPRCLETWETASTSKIAILYAAYQLRREVLEVANADPSLTIDGIRDKLRLRWLKSQVIDTTAKSEVLRADGPKVELRGREVLVDGKNIALVSAGGTNLGPPDIDRIFELTKTGAKWTVKFKGEPDAWFTDGPVMQALQEDVLPAGIAFASPLPAATAVSKRAFTFFEKLWLMIDASHNAATDECLDAIGYLYINSLLWQTGLFDPRRGGGMWVGRHYAGSHHGLAWSAPPGPRLKTRDHDLIQAGMSAASGVAYMTLLHQGKLVDADSSRRMRLFLDRVEVWPKGESIDGSPAADRIRRLSGGSTVLEIFEVSAKVGLGNFDNYFDAALIGIRRLDTGKVFHYAVSFMDYAGGKHWALTSQLANAMYELVDPP